MQTQIIVNVDPGETRVALLENSSFAELHVEREESRSVVGNVVKGRVSRVLPGMQAAFVDIGLEKAAFLYAGDYFDNTNSDSSGDSRRHNRPRSRRGQAPAIDTMLSEGQEIVVQIAKAPIGSKGARITSNISIPGRHLVLTPWSRRVGVSRRIGSDNERRRLRQIVQQLKPENLGFIIRTAGDGVREADLEADIRYLTTTWEKILVRNAEAKIPNVLHAEHDLPLRIIRDLAGPETISIVTDHKETHESLQHFVSDFVAEPRPNVEFYSGSVPLFDHFDLETHIHDSLERKVWLKSGGSLVIDQCEALTAIDINTGAFVGKRDLEETVFKANLEAVKEVVHQLRFRNIGGLIIIDLIDMESAGNRDKVYRALRDALRADKSRTNILKISELGLVEMTRKRTRENLVQSLCEPCPNCQGRGYILSGKTVAYKILREIRNDLPRIGGRQIAVSVNPRVAEQLLGIEEEFLARLSKELGREIEVRARPGLHQEQFEIEALDDGPPVETKLRWLRDPEEIAAEEESAAQERALAKRENRGRGNKAGRNRRTQRGRQRGSSPEIPEIPPAEGESASSAESETPKTEAMDATSSEPATGVPKLSPEISTDTAGVSSEPPQKDGSSSDTAPLTIDQSSTDSAAEETAPAGGEMVADSTAASLPPTEPARDSADDHPAARTDESPQEAGEERSVEPQTVDDAAQSPILRPS